MTQVVRYMPDVLLGYAEFSSISVLRALKHVKNVMEELEPVGERPSHVQAAFDDLDMMIGTIANGRPLKK